MAKAPIPGAGAAIPGLTYGPRNQIAATLVNMKLLIENDPELSRAVAWNAFSGRMVQRVGVSGCGTSLRVVSDPVNGDGWTDDKTTEVRAWLERTWGVVCKDRREAGSALEMAAREKRFNPVAEYLDRCEAGWLGVPQMERFFVDWMGVPDNPYVRETAVIWFVGAVRRVMEPGCRMDLVPVVQGGQGIRKSTAIETLARAGGGEWYVELVGKLEDQKIMEAAEGAWIIELGELAATKGAERIEHIKALVSAAKFKGRKVYRENPETIKRSSVFVGTTNDETPLADVTGGRRFPPLRCDPAIDVLDIKGLEAMVDELWGEARSMYGTLKSLPGGGGMEGVTYYSKAARMYAEQAILDATYMIDEGDIGDPVREHIEKLLKGRKSGDLISTAEIWNSMGKSPTDMTKSHRNLIGKALRGLDVKLTLQRTEVNGKRIGPPKKVWIIQGDR